MNAVIPPLNVAQLNQRLEHVAAELNIPVARARLMLCTLVVSQMLPDAVAVKGGMGVKLRFGERGTRATADFDISTGIRGEVFERSFRKRLAQGWGAVPASKGALRRDPDAPDRVAFTATLRAKKVHDPGLARSAYLMHPYKVSIDFLGRPWGSLDVEVSHPEIDPQAHARESVDVELVQFSRYFGFGRLQSIELVDLEYQMAQKIHAVTDPAYVRAYDLVDLQLLWNAGPDLLKLREFCVRTFDWRCQQKWPPLPLRPMDGWGSAYAAARAETEVDDHSPVLSQLAEARVWFERLIAQIEATTSSDGQEMNGGRA